MVFRSILISFCLQQAFCLQFACGQTQIDLQAQGKNVDFSGSPTTRPLKSGVALPANCSVGDMFFLTSATAGANLYGCAATNSWTLQGNGSGGGSSVQNASQLTDLAASSSSSTTLLIGATCALATPCNVRLGSVTFAFTGSSSATISGGTGTAFIYIDSSGNLTVGHNLTVVCNSGCVAVTGVTAFPSDSVPLFTWTATNGTWDTAGGSGPESISKHGQRCSRYRPPGHNGQWADHAFGGSDIGGNLGARSGHVFQPVHSRCMVDEYFLLFRLRGHQ